MKEVKIVLVQEFFNDDSYSVNIIRDSITDWEQISDEDLQFLRRNLIKVVGDTKIGYEFKPMLIIKDAQPVSVRIKEIKKEIAAAQARIEKARKEREAKRKQKEKDKLLKSQTSEKELFRELAKKYGSELAGNLK